MGHNLNNVQSLPEPKSLSKMKKKDKSGLQSKIKTTSKIMKTPEAHRVELFLD